MPGRWALAAAEIACKAAKDRGRNRVQSYEDSDQSIVRRYTDVTLVGTLRYALARDQFRLEAQPIVTLNGLSHEPRAVNIELGFAVLFESVPDRISVGHVLSFITRMAAVSMDAHTSRLD